jgi:hypothetical protein
MLQRYWFASYASVPRLTMHQLLYRKCILQSVQAAAALIAIDVGSGRAQNSFVSGVVTQE